MSGIDAVHGSVAVAGADVDGMVMSREMFPYRVKDKNEASPVYLQLIVRSAPARELLMGLVTGTSNRTRLVHPEQLLALPIPPLPPIAEQKRVAQMYAKSQAARQSAIYLQVAAEDTAAVAWSAGQVDPDERVKLDLDPEDALRAMLRTPKPARAPRSGGT